MMTDLICPHCQQIIDDGSDGFTSDREIELEKKLDIAVKAFEEIELYRYDVNDIDQEDWFKIATSMAKIAKESLARIKEVILNAESKA